MYLNYTTSDFYVDAGKDKQPHYPNLHNARINLMADKITTFSPTEPSLPNSDQSTEIFKFSTVVLQSWNQ